MWTSCKKNFRNAIWNKTVTSQHIENSYHFHIRDWKKGICKLDELFLQQEKMNMKPLFALKPCWIPYAALPQPKRYYLIKFLFFFNFLLLVMNCYDHLARLMYLSIQRILNGWLRKLLEMKIKIELLVFFQEKSNVSFILLDDLSFN